jgi:hypothetical protein
MGRWEGLGCIMWNSQRTKKKKSKKKTQRNGKRNKIGAFIYGAPLKNGADLVNLGLYNGAVLGCKHSGGKATVNTFLYTLSVSTHGAEKERLCHFSEPDVGKALPFPWCEALGALAWLCFCQPYTLLRTSSATRKTVWEGSRHVPEALTHQAVNPEPVCRGVCSPGGRDEATCWLCMQCCWQVPWEGQEVAPGVSLGLLVSAGRCSVVLGRDVRLLYTLRLGYMKGPSKDLSHFYLRLGHHLGHHWEVTGSWGIYVISGCQEVGSGEGSRLLWGGACLWRVFWDPGFLLLTLEVMMGILSLPGRAN